MIDNRALSHAQKQMDAHLTTADANCKNEMERVLTDVLADTTAYPLVSSNKQGGAKAHWRAGRGSVVLEFNPDSSSPYGFSSSFVYVDQKGRTLINQTTTNNRLNLSVVSRSLASYTEELDTLMPSWRLRFGEV